MTAADAAGATRESSTDSVVAQADPASEGAGAPPAAPSRPMRADARRNYDRILATARVVFAERGTDASLDEIAKRAEVGAGTLYRHFPTREALVDALLQDWTDRVAADADAAIATGAPAPQMLLGWFERGDAALGAFAPGAERVLWPEHFDVGYALDEVNYGVSPGDDGHPEPYAYVGPWQPREGAFWNAPFGASRPAVDLPDADAVVAFFEDGRAAARSGVS